MKFKRVVVSFVIITIIYLSILIWLDYKKSVFSSFPSLLEMLPLLLIVSFVSYLLRYCRWHWLLYRLHYRITFRQGFLAYLTGFAFTATPGKVGELVRIRYFQPMGVPHHRVISAFVFERLFDLIIVLSLASLIASEFSFFSSVVGFVAFFILMVIILASNPRWFRLIVVSLHMRRRGKFSVIVRTFQKGLTGIINWVNPIDIIVSLVLGLLAWGMTSFAFILLLGDLNVIIPFETAIAIYPLSMLAGAASMIPGGVGSTEITIVAILTYFNTPLGLSMLAAVGIRFVTLWFAIVCGLIAVVIME